MIYFQSARLYFQRPRLSVTRSYRVTARVGKFAEIALFLENNHRRGGDGNRASRQDTSHCTRRPSLTCRFPVTAHRRVLSHNRV